MSADNKVPEIRFKGFSGEWKKTVLSDVIDKYDNFRIAVTTKNRITGNTPYYGANGIQDYVKGYTHDGEYILLAEDGANDLKNYPIHYVNGKVWVNNHAHVLKAKAKNSNIFFKYALNKIDFEPFLVGSSRAKLNASVMMNLAFIISTDIKEQTAIGNYFQKLDNLINQHQQKHDKLCNIKKAMLEKMFPKQGKTLPEIRFKGFSGGWEKKLLGEMVTCFSGGTPLVGVEEYYKGNIPFIRSAEINKKTTELTISEVGLKNSSAKIVEVGTVLYALYGATSGEVGRAKIRGAINQAILAIVPKAKICPEFLSHWLRKNKENIVNTYLQGGQGNLSGEIVKNIILTLPDFKEQTAIGNYFQKLDNLINQHQQQITKLNNIKQACLSKMFV